MKLSKTPNVLPVSFACLVFCIGALAAPNATLAQLGTSSMSFNGMAAQANNGNGYAKGNGDYRGRPLLPSPDTIRIEEFINYHKHQLPLPEDGEKIRLSLRHMKIEGDETLVQLGITTPQKFDLETAPPLNLVLVIDQSGSMRDGNRIGKVRNAIDALVNKFRKQDRVAIVGFNDSASVILSSCRKTDRRRIRAAIDSIQAGGSTNLHDGLRLGYKQALENFDSESTNRVLFLTDGNANVGVTEPASIREMSTAFNEKGISLSTIGVGRDFNQQLLTCLADAGHGLSHFVGDHEDIEKIFVGDFESLLAPVAEAVCLRINFGQDTEDVHLFGYSQAQSEAYDADLECEDDEIVLRLKNLNYGVTQVVMATIPNGRKQPRIRATLNYRDASTHQNETVQTRSAKAERPETRAIQRDYAIALLARGLKRAAQYTEECEEDRAERVLLSALRESKRLCDRPDEHVARVREIAKKYVTILEPYCESRESDEPRESR